MKNILRNFVFIVWAVALLPVNVSAQNRRDKEQTYVLEQPYEVTKITPSQGKKSLPRLAVHAEYTCIRLMPSPIIRMTFFIFFP